jgi:hypothetical protein
MFGRSLQEHRERRAAERERNQIASMSRTGIVQRGTFAPVGQFQAQPKESPLESAAYENAVRALGYCVRCGRTCRPQFCHADQHKGMGMKTDVRRGWAGCGVWNPTDPGCHYIVGTSGQMEKQERRAEEDRLAAITRAEVERLGLWPRSVPKWILS